MLVLHWGRDTARSLNSTAAPRLSSCYPADKPSTGAVCVLHAADIWDTAGQDRFNSLHPSYYYRAHACLMVFDVTRKVTYKNLDRQVAGRLWLSVLQQWRMHCQ